MPHFEPVLRLAFGRAPRPQGRPLGLSDVPDDLILRSASATQRQTLLVGLALSHRETKSPELLNALRRVAGEGNSLALQQVLEVLARSASLGFVVEALGLEWLLALGVTRGVHVSDVLATTDTVTERGLTREESRRIVENFGRTLDPASIRFRFTTGVMTMGAGALVLGNVIHVDPSDPRWTVRRGTTLNDEPDNDAWDSFNGVLLAHEPSHIWSYQHQGSRYAVNSVTEQLAAMQGSTRNAAYTYSDDKAHFLEFGEEQRAMVVQDFVAATRAKAKGLPTSGTMLAGVAPVDDTLRRIGKYIEQMRAMGPGQPTPGFRREEWIVCACVHGFSQDGGAQLAAQQVGALVGAVGREAQQAVLRGVTTGDVGQLALGAAGVGAAVAASMLTREQAGNGGKSGGSAMLDQAGLPRGVELGRDGVTGSVKAAWDAGVPKPDALPIGIADPRVEWGVGVHRDVGDVRVDADGRAVIGLGGDVRQASVAVRVDGGDVAASVRAGIEPKRAWAHVSLETNAVNVTAGVDVSPRSVAAHAGVETKPVQFDAKGTFSRHSADAPLQLDEATLSATVQPTSGVSLGTSVKLVPHGVDAVSAQLAAIHDKGSLSVAVDATELTKNPSVGVTVTASEKKSGVAVSGHVKTTPSTGEVQGGVNVSIPLPDPGKKS